VDIAPAAPGSTASRAVRTVTVRADGTVVESTVPAADAPTDVQVEAANARPVEVVSVSPAGVSVNTQPIADAVSAAQRAAQSATNATADTVQNAAQAALDQATQAVTTTAPPVPVARPCDGANAARSGRAHATATAGAICNANSVGNAGHSADPAGHTTTCDPSTGCPAASGHSARADAGRITVFGPCWGFRCAVGKPPFRGRSSGDLRPPTKPLRLHPFRVWTEHSACRSG
jgi:hypothetical protein